MLKLGGISSNGNKIYRTFFCTDCMSVIGKQDYLGNCYPEGWNKFSHCPYCGKPLYEKKQEEKVKIEITWTKEN